MSDTSTASAVRGERRGERIEEMISLAVPAKEKERFCEEQEKDKKGNAYYD